MYRIHHEFYRNSEQEEIKSMEPKVVRKDVIKVLDSKGYGELLEQNVGVIAFRERGSIKNGMQSEITLVFLRMERRK